MPTRSTLERHLRTHVCEEIFARWACLVAAGTRSGPGWALTSSVCRVDAGCFDMPGLATGVEFHCFPDPLDERQLTNDVHLRLYNWQSLHHW